MGAARQKTKLCCCAGRAAASSLTTVLISAELSPPTRGIRNEEELIFEFFPLLLSPSWETPSREIGAN